MKYKYIWAWEILKGTVSADMVRGIVSLARDENAPEKSIMRLDDGTWLTVDDIKNKAVVKSLEDQVKRMEP